MDGRGTIQEAGRRVRQHEVMGIAKGAGVGEHEWEPSAQW